MWMIYTLLSLTICITLSYLSVMSSFKEMTSSSEVYECGIDPFVEDKCCIYFHFFMIGVLFVMFDVELIICIPLVMLVLPMKTSMMFWLLFFFILYLGLILEIMSGTLDWKE